MEIKNCEEYVLAELNETKENLLKLGESNLELREENAALKADLRFICSLIELRQRKDDNEGYLHMGVYEYEYDGTVRNDYVVAKKIIEGVING